MIRKTSQLTIVFAIIATFFCSVVPAQESAPTDEKSETKTGAISGRVVNENGHPIANAAVYVRAYGSNGQARSTSTDGDGTFQVSGLDPLAYLVSASLPAYTPAPRDPDSPQATYFRLGDSVRLELIKGAVITGTVTSAAGEPVVAVRVRVYMIRDGNGQPSRYEMLLSERPTDDRGVYRVYGLPPGTYVISAGGGGSFSGFNIDPYETDAPTYAPASTRDTATEVSVRSGEEATNVDIRYRGEPGHVVSGIASGAAGPSGFSIRLRSISNGGSLMSVTSFQRPGSGGFAFNGVADGDYNLIAQSTAPGGEVAASEQQRIRVRGADVTGIELTTNPLGSIAGRVVLEESKAPECKGKRRPLFAETLITPWQNEKNVPKDQPLFLWGTAEPVIPDQRGDFTLRNLAPGQYRFSTRSLPKYWYLQSMSLTPSVPPAARAAPANRPVDAARSWTTLKSAERISGLSITLAAGAASFHGQIMLTEGQKLTPKLFTYLVPAEREKAEDVLRFFASQVASDGTFALNNLAPGRYWAIVRPAGENESNILSKLHLPEETDSRAKLRREAEAAKTEIEFKPCQNVTDYQLPLRPR